MTRKRDGTEVKAKVALEAIKGALTLAELFTKHSFDQAVIATGEAELTRLHAKIGQLVVDGIFWRRPPVGRAAVRLNMTQPPLSRQLQQPEHVIGVALVVRSSRVVRLTTAGCAFLPNAEVVW